MARRTFFRMPAAGKSWYVRDMSFDLLRRNGARILVLGLWSVLGAGALAGCNQGDARAEGGATQPVAPETGKKQAASSKTQPAAAVPAAAQSQYLEEAFDLKFLPPKELKVGEPLEFRVVLASKAPYKVNAEYPIKFRVDAVAGLSAQKETVVKSDGKVGKNDAQLPVFITVEKPGKYVVSGRLSFSVCTDERCLIEKRDLAVTVNAG